MKYRYLSVILILLILSIGAVSAQENSTDDIVGIEQDNGVLSASEYVIDDSNYATYFNETTGFILENSNISDGDTIKLGNVNNKTFSIDKILTVTSNSSSDILTNVSFYFLEGSDNSTISDLNFVNHEAFDQHAITVMEASNIVISDNIIDVESTENPDLLYAVCALYADNLNVKANSITYVGKTNGTKVNSALAVFYSENVTVEGNTFNISIPSADVDWSSGSSKTTGVKFIDCDNLEFAENAINLNTDVSLGSYPTVYAVEIKESDNVVVGRNNISAYSNNISSYIYALVINGDNFNISSNEFIAISDTNYTCAIDVEGLAGGVIEKNLIYAAADDSAYGIYTANWAGDVKVDIIYNPISVRANSPFAISLSGSEALVERNAIVVNGNFTTGIASAVGNITIIQNALTINGSNVGIPLGYDMMGVETTGVHIVSGNATVTENAIKSTGEYAVDFDGEGQVTDNEIRAEIATGDFAVDYAPDQNVLVENNTPDMDYKLTNDTFFIYFYEDGYLKDQVRNDNLTFIGEFSNLVEAIFIDRPIALLSDNATLNNMTIFINSENVTVDGFNLIGELAGISISDADNVEITNNNFTVTSEVDANNLVIGIRDSNNVLIENNTIVLGVKTNGTYKNRAIDAQDSENLTISGNTVVASLPARPIDWGSGAVYSRGVVLDGCDNAYLFNNTIAVKSNDQISTYDTIYAADIKGDNASLIGNRIGVLEAPYGYGVVISGENFEIAENEIYVGQNGTYACAVEVDGTANGMVATNLIYAFANDTAYGIYAANWAGDVVADIADNFIMADANSPFGMSLSGSEALVENNNVLATGNHTTGIVSAVRDITINNNTINANGSNVGTPLGYDMFGIETTGVHIVGGNAIVTNNKINATSKYAVDFLGEGNVTDNEIYAVMLTGDFAVNYSQNASIVVANNTPEMELDYKLTNDTFYIYFDEEGLIREQIEADNLTFIGEFSNLTSVIFINKPIKVLSDNATLNNISMVIFSGDVVVDGFNFTGEQSGIGVEFSDNVQIINNNFNVTGLADDSNFVIQILGSENVSLENNTLIFGVESNGTFNNIPVYAADSNNLSMIGNNITASLPARSINWTTGDVYSQGVFLEDCDNAVLDGNIIGVKSNDQIGTYDTIYAVNIKGDNATLTKNQIGAIEAPYGYALVMTGENFNITNNMLVACENGTYACGIDVESNSNGVIEGNLIYAIANDTSYGIYTANWAGDVKANITKNLILSESNSPFGMSLSGSEASLEKNSIVVEGNYTTGIASAIEDITINNNTIIANGSNVGTPLGYDSMGVETTGIHIVSGNAKVTDNNVTTTGEFAVDLDGTGQVTDNYLVADVYTGDASVDYTPDQKTMVQNNTPAMQRAIISAEDIVMYYKNGTRYVIVLTDQERNPLVNKTVTLTINGASYIRNTDENGTASIAINLNSGNYTASASYVGESGYSNATSEINITVLSTVFGDDIVKMFKNGTQYYATFLDGQGNPLAHGTAVTFNINGVFYTRQVNGSEGKAKLNINLVPGVYIITAINPVNGEMHANNVTVLATIEGNDLVKYYRNESQYVVTVYGADGKLAGAGESVTFNINGVFYTRTTNASGQARLNINLQPGNYTITAEYNGAKLSNNIEVKPVLSANNLVKKYGTSDQFIAYLVDGQGNPYPGQTVNFNIHGRLYERVTDTDGRAILNIKLSAAANVYYITSSYNGSSITNTITVLP